MVINSGCQLNWIVGVADQLSPPRCINTQQNVRMMSVTPINCKTRYNKRNSPYLLPLFTFGEFGEFRELDSIFRSAVMNKQTLWWTNGILWMDQRFLKSKVKLIHYNSGIVINATGVAPNKQQKPPQSTRNEYKRVVLAVTTHWSVKYKVNSTVTTHGSHHMDEYGLLLPYCIAKHTLTQWHS